MDINVRYIPYSSRRSYKATGNPFYKHGMTESKEYNIWRHMKQRCLLTSNAAYVDYGGRGITLDSKWVMSFQDFFRDMGRCPVNKTLDRINNDLGYYKDNCRWVTRKEQACNRRQRRWWKKPG